MVRTSEDDACTKRVSDDSLRRANAILALALVAFFLAHALLGALWLGGVLANELAWVAWLGVIVIAVHVIMCSLTSARQLGDERFPPSKRKKRHLALKWVTGAVLLAVILAHVLVPEELASSAVAIAPVIIASIALFALAWHVCVCGKSLLRDLGVKTSHKTAFAIIVIITCALIECVLLANV